MTRSRARAGFDLLVATYPDWDVLVVDWQKGRGLLGPWVLVTLGQPSSEQKPSDGSQAFARHHFAIWKTTGNVYGLQHDQSVTDEPLLTLDVPE